MTNRFQACPFVILTVLIIHSFLAVALADADPGKAHVIIESPSRVFGGRRVRVSVDDRTRRARLRKGEMALDLPPARYAMYLKGSAVRQATLELDAGTSLIVSLRSRVPGNRSARLVVVQPQSVFHDRAIPVSFGKRKRRARLGRDSITVLIQPGIYAMRSAGGSKDMATLDAVPGGVYYFVDHGDPESHRILGDKLYADGNLTGAFAHYRAAVNRDTTATELYSRYAELAIRTNKTRDTERALTLIVGAGLADAVTYRRLGDLRLTKKRYTDATRYYEKALAEDPNNPAALSGLGAARLKTGDAAGAVKACAAAVDLQPDTARHYQALGDAYLAAGDSAKAMAAYSTFFARGGESSAAAYVLGSWEYERRRFKDAAKHLELVKGRRAQAFDYLHMRGESLYRLGAHREAFPVLRLAANKYPRARGWPEVVELLIKSYVALEDERRAKYWVKKYAARSRRKSPDVAYYQAYLQERTSPATARALYQKNIRAYPRDHRNYLRLGLLESRNRKTLSASVAHLKKAVSLADTIPEAWLEIANAYRRLKRPDDELAALRVFVASEPQHPEANARMGGLMMRKGKTGEAVRTLEKASEAGSRDPKILLALAQGYVRSGRHREAVTTLEKAKGLAPNDVTIRRELAELYSRTGDRNKAIDEYREVIGLRRDNETLFRFARLLYQTERYSEAENAIEDIRATDPTDLDALMLLGRILRAQGRHDEAIEVYKEIAMIDPSNSDALRARADAHLESNQINWAKTFYQRALRNDSRNALAALGLARVAKMRGDNVTYLRHLNRARRMDSRNPEIKREYEASR
ncbi:MAG: tetratricopeptide repeat protein [Chitinivibrionales bacterium]|nr:tetratricopeptide repeat protein [Chitinivibrionales bacterium]MBD3395647.1 tetratricopeptide repeat protein [Chitinivibrionales bacterium]